MANRGTKSKIAGEILLLSLFVDNSDNDFPVDTLEKRSTKVKPNKKQGETSSDLANAEASTTPEVSDNKRDRTEKDSPNDLQRRLEKFVIGEEDPVTSYGGTTIPVTVSKLQNTRTSTSDLFTKRSIPSGHKYYLNII